MTENPADLELTEISDLIRTGQLSSTEVVVACVERAEAAQARLNCFFEIEKERALKTAQAVDTQVACGKDPGLLAGAPLAHKDLYFRKDAIASCGSDLCRNYRPDTESTTLLRLQNAGAVNLGRLHMSELANGSTGQNVFFGHCRNPWDINYSPGGSSSGNGAATATRAIGGGMGSDTGGSIRIPASMCGLVGLRPTQSRVTRHGVMPLSFSFDCCGPLTRSVRDSARILTVVAGYDVADQTSSRQPVPNYEKVCGSSVDDLRIGVPIGYYDRDVNQEIENIVVSARRVLEKLGCSLVEVRMPDHDTINELWNVIQLSEVASVHEQWLRERPNAYSEQIRRRIETGLYITASDYLRAASLRAEITNTFLKDIFERCDVLVTPTLPDTPPRLADTDVGEEGTGNKNELNLAAWHAMMLRISGFTRPASFLGLPAMSVPAGFTSDNLPVGMQLIGRPFDESTLFRIGSAYQSATGHHRSIPTFG